MSCDTKKSREFSPEGNIYTLAHFIQNLGKTVGIGHFWELLSHRDLAALVLSCRLVTGVLIEPQIPPSGRSVPANSIPFVIWSALARRRFLDSSLRVGDRGGLDDWRLQLSAFGNDPKAMFLTRPWIRGDGVYAHFRRSEWGPGHYRIFRFIMSTRHVIVLTTTLGPPAVAKLLRSAASAQSALSSGTLGPGADLVVEKYNDLGEDASHQLAGSYFDFYPASSRRGGARRRWTCRCLVSRGHTREICYSSSEFNHQHRAQTTTLEPWLQIDSVRRAQFIPDEPFPWTAQRHPDDIY